MMTWSSNKVETCSLHHFSKCSVKPSKFISRALLHPPQSEGRPLVQQPLDITSTVLQQPNKIPTESGHPLWAETTRRLLAEEGHGLSQLIVIYQLIMRQPDLSNH